MMAPWQSIPGETPIDPSGLRPALRKVVHTRAQLNPLEADNIRAAIVKYLADTPNRRRAPFTLPWVLKLHKEMLGRVWSWAGRIRTVELNLGAPAWRIQTDLHELLQDLLAWEASAMPPAEQAARLHYRAVHIHPFENGNGRWARLLANIWLKQHGQPLTIWPEEGITAATSPVRQHYLAALQAADGGDMGPLIDLHNRFAAPPADYLLFGQSRKHVIPYHSG
ncbi:MAG: mobile mystery protein B [Planctomycetota bacterium]|nr:mobile mystery protein B [Planctomycetota bacterium]